MALKKIQYGQCVHEPVKAKNAFAGRPYCKVCIKETLHLKEFYESI